MGFQSFSTQLSHESIWGKMMKVKVCHRKCRHQYAHLNILEENKHFLVLLNQDCCREVGSIGDVLYVSCNHIIMKLMSKSSCPPADDYLKINIVIFIVEIFIT